MSVIVGRREEQEVLRALSKDDEPRLVAVYGRRLVGKTFLIRSFFRDAFDFSFTGSYGVTTKVQLSLFASALTAVGGESSTPKDWFAAFEHLKQYLNGLQKERILVFIDELPWLDTPKSNFLAAFSYFWNSWGSFKAGLKVIICGSATSWMINKIIGDRGGLYGRCSRQIYLRPFTLAETEACLRSRNIRWPRHRVLETYMILGGIPYYLNMLEGTLPLAVNIDRLFFNQTAPLRREFDFLFRSLFPNSPIYLKVVELLARKKKGLTLAEIKESLESDSGGSLSTVLDNLAKCDFIRKYTAYGRKIRGALFQLTDPYVLFYLEFLAHRTGLDEEFWSKLPQAQHSAWVGCAFERVCLAHVRQMKSKLGIQGVLTHECCWASRRQTDKEGNVWPGAQIDLLLDRADGIIDLCEMKFSDGLYALSAADIELLRRKTEVFRHFQKTQSVIHIVLVTPYGLKENVHRASVDNVVMSDDLFCDR